jgi:hypothetical protein
MTIVPNFESPCDLAQRLPGMVAEFLSYERKLDRRFREETVTDIIVASLLKIGATAILPKDESKTGNDFDILIASSDLSSAIQYRIQSKRISYNQKNWEISSYKELDHPNGNGSQSQNLILSSSHEKVLTLPLYAFYNTEEVCLDSGGLISGIELADARYIRMLIHKMISERPGRKLPFKRISELRSLFFPLSTILCPTSNSDSRSIIGPFQSRSAAEREIQRTREMPKYWTSDEGVPTRFPRLPSPRRRLQRETGSPSARSRALPIAIQNLLERRGDERVLRAAVKRPKIVLMSNGQD